MSQYKLTHDDKQALLAEGLPYHIQGLVLLMLADQQHVKILDGQDVRFDLNGNSLAPNILLNALYEAGVVHLRYLAEFLGLSVGPTGKRKISLSRLDDDLRVDDLNEGNFTIESLTWEMLVTSKYLSTKFSDALQKCLVSANKLVAHPTKHIIGADHRVSSDDLRLAVTGIVTILMNVVYIPLGRADFLLEKCPGLEWLSSVSE